MNAQQIVLAGPYNFFYACAFAVAFALAVRRGTRSGIPARPLVLLLVCCATAGVLGSRLLPFDLASVTAGEKTVLGGLVAVAMAALAARFVLRLDARYSDSLAEALPVGFAIGRIGCFLAGCCAGSATDLPWGVHYPGADEAVHPTQLYEAAGALLIAMAARHRLRGKRDLLIPGVILPYLALRFGLQFLREHNGGAFGTTQVMTLIAAGVLWLAHSQVSRCNRSNVSATRWPIALSTAAVLVILAARTVTPLEAATLAGLALAGVGVMIARTSRSTLRTVPAFASMIALQQADTSGSRQYLTVGAGAMSGSYVESCGGAHRYAMGGASIAYTSVPRPGAEISARAQIFAGRDRDLETAFYVDSLLVDGVSDYSVTGFAFTISGQSKWIGGRAGVAVGDLMLDGDPVGAFPVLGLRVGPPQFFAEGKLADFEPAALPAPVIQLGLGTRLTPEGSELRFGVSDAGFYLDALLVKNGWELQPRAAFGDSDTHQLSIALRKQFELGTGGRR